VPVHGKRVFAQPSLGVGSMSIRAVDVLVVPDYGGIHANAVTAGNVRACYLEPARWRDSRHCEADARVQTHGFFDGCAQEWKSGCFAEGWRGAQLAGSRGIVNLLYQLRMNFWVLHEVVEDGAHGDCRGVRAGKAG